MLLRSFPGVRPLTPGTGKSSVFCGTVSTMLSALPLLCTPTPLIFGEGMFSAVPGLLSTLPLFLLLLNSPCAFGALATLRSFLASSSFPAEAVASLGPLSPACFLGVCGLSGGDGGTLLSL